MRNFYQNLSFSPVAICGGMVAVLAVAYIGLIAVVMSYAALTISFSQSVKNDEASVAVLEGQYLDAVVHITTTNYTSAGYSSPVTKTFVRERGVTALR